MTVDRSRLQLRPTGAPEVDAEHGAIMDILSAMDARAGAGLDELQALRDELAEHFSTESAVMAALAPDRREQHELAHRTFLAEVDVLAEMARRGGTVGGDAVTRLMLWFIVHSNTADTELAEAIAPKEEAPPLIVMEDWLASLEEDGGCGDGDLADGNAERDAAE